MADALSTVEFLLGKDVADARPCLIIGDRVATFGELRRLFDGYRKSLKASQIKAGTVATIEADYSPETAALLLAAIDHGLISVPIVSPEPSQRQRLRELAHATVALKISDDQKIEFENLASSTEIAPLYAELHRRKSPGLVLFSSGTSGTIKAAVHDMAKLLEKFRSARPARRMAAFLHLDHIGGFNTLLASLAGGGCLVVLPSRDPAAVVRAIEKHRIEVLPTSPTFLNLFLLSRAWEGRDISSLDLITYGTEPMPEATLKTLHATFPNIRLHQTYGLSEVGILRSKSKSSDSLWMKIGGEGFETRIVNGLLEIKAESAMLGYLNAPSPITEDGWYRTGDAVEVDGEWLRIIGRESEVINVGGEKVHPADIEGVLQLMDGVEEVLVAGEAHPVTGSILKASVRLSRPEDSAAFRKRLREYCQGKLRPFQIPQKIEIVTEALHGERFKKRRAPQG